MHERTIDETDLQKLLLSRYCNGADFWATPDEKISIDQPISTLTALFIMSELKVSGEDEALIGAAELVLSKIKQDGRIMISPKGSIYPCHTAVSAAALCRNGYSDHPKVKLMLDYLRSNRYEDGGWRCAKFIYGHGPETNHSNPGVTLFALDSFRCAGMHKLSELDTAVETLLNHWTIRTPMGPCHFGIGKQFMKIEYPFLRYNLFYYIYILSFYSKAQQDYRFLEALALLRGKLDDHQRIRVENPNRKLSDFEICEKGKPSSAATARYLEIIENLRG